MKIRDDAMAIWQAGVAAVDSQSLVKNNVDCSVGILRICGTEIDLENVERIEVVGGGKAGAGMTRGLLAALEPLLASITVDGWVNVPDDCVEKTSRVHLHSARPAGINEPTAAGVDGTQEILRKISRMQPNDVCVVLISGGGSALLPAPIPEVTLDQKLTVTRVLASAGAPIHDLNIVRSQLSQIKGGGLLRNCTAKKLVTLIISDVIGDPVDIIASGPTVPSKRTADDALEVLKRYDPKRNKIPASVYSAIEKSSEMNTFSVPPCSAENHIIGSNEIAVAAARAEARLRGFDVISLGSENCGEARQHGCDMLARLMSIRDSHTQSQRTCLLAGGETTVALTKTNLDRRGGRNQEVVLGAIAGYPDAGNWKNVALLSGGTDGEDGPTDAAGAFADETLVTDMHRQNLSPTPYLEINNSYAFFQQLNGLLQTGPTHTNVMDLAVGIVG